MRLNFVSLLGLSVLGISLLTAVPANAQNRQQWGGDRWGSGWDRQPSRIGARGGAEQSREARVSSEHFVGDGAESLLGRGPIRIAALPDSTPEGRDLLTYEAATLDRLVLAGYDTLLSAEGSGQVAEIRIRQLVAEPAEARRNPVSGEGSVMVSNRGTAVGMAVAVDFTEPRTALIATHMDLQIKDRESGAVLWEARAQMTTREGDANWGPDEIAARLSAALFEGFPRGT